MKQFLYLLCAALGACAHTTGTIVRNPKTGITVLETSSDSLVMSLGADGSFYAMGLNHSVPIMARSTGAANILNSVGSAAGSGARAFAGSGVVANKPRVPIEPTRPRRVLAAAHRQTLFHDGRTIKPQIP